MPTVIDFEATGTRWWLTFFNPADVILADKAILIVRDFERKYSRFLEDSLVVRLNDEKRLVSPPKELVSLLLTCAKYYEQTDGLFNISVGGLLEKSGYGKLHQTSGAKVSSDLKKDIVVSNELIAISDKIRIDLGGIGKGWLIDKLVAFLRTKTDSAFIVNGGGDLYVSSALPVRVELEHPLDQTQSIGFAELQNQALAVSSPKKRHWKDQDGLMTHHIIDPQTASAKSDFLASYVMAPTACEADVLGTVLLVANTQQRKNIYVNFSSQYLLVHDDMTQTRSRNLSIELY